MGNGTTDDTSSRAANPGTDRRWLVTGASGQLGSHVSDALSLQFPREPVVRMTRSATDGANMHSEVVCDLACTDTITRALSGAAPTHIIHTAAMTSVGACHADPHGATLVNAGVTRQICEWAQARNARVVFTSTDMVFDGEAAPYREADAPKPLSHYGRTKLQAEQLFTREFDGAVARLPLMVGLPRNDRRTTFVEQCEALHTRKPLRLFVDEFRTPIHLADAANALIALAASSERGSFHVAGPQRLSRFEIVEQVAAAIGIKDARLEEASRTSIASAEPRPRDLSLCSDRFRERFPDVTIRTIKQAIGSCDTHVNR